ncbi:KIF13B [Symbiodinium natans]|uniref:KIF13B protein n=1 Tax=Symbiodinium natans TaxID=878477 RepID=A0A812SIU8_9DINO|nr:KIF13B [Symbiodinium natans]
MAKTPRAGGKVDDTIFVGVRLRPFLGYEGKQQCLTPSRNVISVRAPDKKKEYAFDCVDCRVQILEIYNEKVRDLLDDKDTGKSPEIHVHPRIGVYVDGAVDAQVEAVDQVQKLLDSGLSRASVAATARNARSSRGHVVFRLVIERHEEDHTVVTSELFCVDLAGRENEKTTKVTGQNFTELTFINRSLMWLAQCIQALGKQAQARRRSSSVGSEVEGSNRARFRNSKLTLLLINALTGNSKTCLLATVSPALVNLDESLVTLNFASTVKTIKVAARRAERRDTVKLVQSLSEELASLREQLSGSPRNASDLQAQVGTLQNMMESYKTRWEEAEHNAELLRKEKEDALQNLAVSRWKFAQATLKNEARDEPNSARGQETPSQDKDHRDPGARAKASWLSSGWLLGL